MKRLLFISLLLCVPFIAEAQYSLWDGVAEAGKDTVIMISDAADSVISRWAGHRCGWLPIVIRTGSAFMSR